MNKKTIKRIAKSIYVHAHISDGDDLVEIIGQGKSNDNLDALIHWVSEQKDLL